MSSDALKFATWLLDCIISASFILNTTRQSVITGTAEACQSLAVLVCVCKLLGSADRKWISGISSRIQTRLYCSPAPSWFPLSRSHMESLRPEPVCLELASCVLAEQHEFFIFYTKTMIPRCASRTYISEEMGTTCPCSKIFFKNNSLDVM